MKLVADRLAVIVGPTATGKSRLAIELARTFNGEIVSADSRQVYRYMDIGTSKPTTEELILIPHHLINIVEPDEKFSLARYQELAYQAINDIQARNRLPFLVGGSGLYAWSVLEGWKIPQVPPDEALRQCLEEEARANSERLYHQLLVVDPLAGQRIDPRNVRRVARALEVYRSTQLPFSRLQSKEAPPYKTLIIGLTADRIELYRRIDARVDRMIEQGFVGEVERLLNMGYDSSLPAMSGIGYKQISAFLRGEMTLLNAIQQTKFETHRVARHQHSWFRLDDSRVHWFNILDDPGPQIMGLVGEFAENSQDTLDI